MCGESRMHGFEAKRSGRLLRLGQLARVGSPSYLILLAKSLGVEKSQVSACSRRQNQPIRAELGGPPGVVADVAGREAIRSADLPAVSKLRESPRVLARSGLEQHRRDVVGRVPLVYQPHVDGQLPASLRVVLNVELELTS